MASVLTVPQAKLCKSDAPLVLIYPTGSGDSGATLGLIGVLAPLNGALIQVRISIIGGGVCAK